MNSNRKGKRGERLWCDLCREHGYTDARRGQQYAGDPTAPDVVGGPVGWHAEVKFAEILSVREAMRQAERDCGNAKPYVAWKKKNQPWLVTLRAEDFLEMCRRLEQP